MNIEHEYAELAGAYRPFEGLCLVDTFELAESKQMSLFTAGNTERVERQKAAPIFVILGNPVLAEYRHPFEKSDLPWRSIVELWPANPLRKASHEFFTAVLGANGHRSSLPVGQTTSPPVESPTTML